MDCFDFGYKFQLFTALKKKLSTSPTVTVAVEVLFLTPFAAILLAYFHISKGGCFGNNFYTSLLLAFSGPLTGSPLVLFSYAVRKVTLSTLGILQYINPSLQLVCATIFLAEPLSQWHVITFPMIWLALIIYSLASIYDNRI